MKIPTVLKTLLGKPEKVLSTLDDYKQDALIRQGRAQFEKLLKKGLEVPIALL